MATSVTGTHIKALTLILIVLFVSRCMFNIVVALTHVVDFEVAGVCAGIDLRALQSYCWSCSTV